MTIDAQHSQGPEISPWLTPLEAAQYLKVALGTIHNWTSQRVVPFVRRGGLVRYHREDLDRWLRSGGGAKGRTTKSDLGPR